MTLPYHFIPNLLLEIPEIQPNSIISRTIYQDDHLKVILFGFAIGQELSEHTASVPAIIHILEGEARMTLGKDEMLVGAGAWVRMEANLPHSIYAETPLKMLLLMFQK